MLKGCDISNWQGTVNKALFGRYHPDFTIVLATQGTWFTDPNFAADWQMLGELAIPRIAYGFGEMVRSSGRADAEKFLSVVGNGQGGDIAMLDFEDLPPGSPQLGPTDDLLAYAVDWTTTVEAAWGVPPWIYSRIAFLQAHQCTGSRAGALGRNGIVLADWQTLRFPVVPQPWPFLAGWQYGQGPIPGIAGPVDLDLYNGDAASLRKYGKP